MRNNGGQDFVKNLWKSKIRSHVKQFIRKLKGDKKLKHRKRNHGSGVSSRSKISRAMQWRIPKIPVFLAIRNQNNEEKTNMAS